MNTFSFNSNTDYNFGFVHKHMQTTHKRSAGDAAGVKMPVFWIN